MTYNGLISLLADQQINIADVYYFYVNHYIPYAPMTDLFQALIEDRWISSDDYLVEKFMEIVREYQGNKGRKK